MSGKYSSFPLALVFLCALGSWFCPSKAGTFGEDRSGGVCSSMTEPSAASVRWVGPSNADLEDLCAWRSAVGPVLVLSPAGSPTEAGLDSLAIVVWNTAVGGGDVGDLIRDLRAGLLTGGRPVKHYVLLLQEVFRTGSSVPSIVSADARYASRITRYQRDGDRVDIERLASGRRLGLCYVPSMRNGSPGADGFGEDRGNAIVSTLPLSDFTAIELPLERERRVAVAATVRGTASDGTPWSLRFACVHLDSRADWETFYRGFGDSRLDQTRYLIDVLNDDEAIVIGGDFNTWFMGAREPAIALMRAHFPQSVTPLETWTARGPLWLADRQMDYIFFRLPHGWEGRYCVIRDTYGSDHRPLLGWVVLRGAGVE